MLVSYLFPLFDLKKAGKPMHMPKQKVSFFSKQMSMNVRKTAAAMPPLCVKTLQDLTRASVNLGFQAMDKPA